MEFIIGQSNETVAKEQVTRPERVHPFGGMGGPRPTSKLSPQQLRRWADTSEWVRAAINHRRVQVSQANWDIAPIDPNKDTDEEMQAILELLFLHPNRRQRTFRELIEPVVEDILVLDAGTIEKELNLNGVSVALHVVDGATIRIDPMWDGDPNNPRYIWAPRGTPVASLLDRQLIYIMSNPTSHRVVGFSPLEALKVTIDADLEAAQYNKRVVSQVNPTGVLMIGENVSAATVDAFRMYWDAEVAGKKQMAIMGGVKSPEFINLGQTAKEMQFMQWQVYLLRKIAAVFGIAPQDLGITFDINRANAQAQQEISEDRGFKPLVKLIEEQINAKVIADFAQQRAKQLFHAGHIDENTMRLAVGLSHINPRGRKHVFEKLHAANVLNLMFRFQLRSSKSARDRAAYNRSALAGLPWETVDEVRAEDGLDRVEGGDEIIVPTPIGPIPLSVISGAELPRTDEQRRYLDLLFSQAQVRVRSGRVTDYLPASEEPEEVEVPVPVEVEVDEDGDPVEE